MKYKFSYEEKINFYEEALNGFRMLNAGPWICTVLAYLVRRRGMYTGDPTELCRESFPEFWEEVELYGIHPDGKFFQPAFPKTEQGNLMRQAALNKAIDKCKIYLGLIPSTPAFYIRPALSERMLFIEEMEKFNWPEIQTMAPNFSNSQQSKINKMKEENLIKGNRLSDEIKSTQRHIDIWNEATMFSTECYTPICNGSSSVRSGKLPEDAFDVIRKISLAYLRAKLFDLEKQFETL